MQKFLKVVPAPVNQTIPVIVPVPDVVTIDPVTVPEPATVPEDSSSLHPSPDCQEDCCDLTSAKRAGGLTINRAATCRVIGKRKRFFCTTWLDDFDWLVLCNTKAKAFCQLCR